MDKENSVGTNNLDLNGNGISNVNAINGKNVVNSSTKEYDIQKNGSDGNGIINFKT